MASVEFVHTETGRRAVWINTVTFARELAENIGGFLEVTSAVGDGAHRVVGDTGTQAAPRAGHEQHAAQRRLAVLADALDDGAEGGEHGREGGGADGVKSREVGWRIGADEE